MQTSGIYRIVNLVTGKLYIGLSTDIFGRLRQHLSDLRNGSHHNAHLQRAFILHGEGSFEFEVLELCDAEELSQREQFYISEYRSYDPNFGYNKTYGGEFGSHTEETRKRISSSHANVSGQNNPRYGVSMSEETKIKISVSLRGRSKSDVTKQKIGEANKGKVRTAEQRRRYSEANSGENHPQAKLSDVDKIAIRNSTLSTKELCEIYGVTKSTIYRARKLN